MAAKLKEHIQSLEKQLGKIFASLETTKKSAPKKRGKMSAAGRKRIAMAQKRRWAKIRANAKK